jgi:hypothetical protein
MQHSMAPGINPYRDWPALAKFLGDGRQPIVAGDFAAYDATQNPMFHKAILDIINSWYSDDHGKAREILFGPVTNSKHVFMPGGLPEDIPFEVPADRDRFWKEWDTFRDTKFRSDPRFFVQWYKSLPSGHPLTTILNCMYSLLLLIYAFLQLCPDLDVWDNVAPMVFGDDNIMAVSLKAVGRYNLQTIAQALATIGVTYTAADKQETEVEYQQLEEVTFLKRGFMKRKQCDSDEGTWVGPLSKESIYDMVAYRHRSTPVQQFMKESIAAVAMEMSIHVDPRKFDARTLKCTDENWEYVCALADRYFELTARQYIAPSGLTISRYIVSARAWYNASCAQRFPLQMYLTRPNRQDD